MRSGAAGKELALGGVVVFHISVVVQMLMGEVGENGGMVKAVTDPFLLQCMGGDFHDAGAASRVPHPCVE